MDRNQRGWSSYQRKTAGEGSSWEEGKVGEEMNWAECSWDRSYRVTHIHELGWLPPRSRIMAGQEALAFLPVAGEGREIGADERQS